MRRLPAIPFIWLLTIMVPFPLAAQKAEEIERLKSKLIRSNPDTAQIRILLAIAMTYEGYNTDSAMAYALKTLGKANEINHLKGRADAMLHIGRLKRGQNKEVEALNHMFEALKLYREIDDKVQIANSLNDISIIYANSGDYQNSLHYFGQALDIFRQTGDEKGESYALNNIGIIHQEMDDDVSAEKYFIQSLKIKIRNKDLYGISRGYTNLGSIAENNKRWDDAMRYYQKADSIYVVTNDKQVQGPNYLAMARIMRNQEKMTEARKLALKALETSEDINELSVMLSCSKFIAELDERAGNYRSSLWYQKLYNTIADSLNNKNHEAILEELKAKFNLEEKEREIVLLTKDKELHEAVARNSTLAAYTLSGGILFLMLISGVTYYAYRTTKAARDSLASKNREIEQQKNDLDKLNREKDRFFSILSHDLRSPLNSIKGLSYLLVHHSDDLTPDESKKISSKIDAGLDNVTELINNILEWSMTTSKKRKWTFEKFDIAALIRKNISLYQGIAESKDVRLNHTGSGGLFAYADRQAIDTVIRNLLSNSIKFSHPGSTVTVTASAGENNILVSVKDHGIGIPPDLQEKLFTISSITQPGTKSEKGTGIGLLLCKELLKENNGDITLKSRPGEGSEFIVSIPSFDEYSHNAAIH